MSNWCFTNYIFHGSKEEIKDFHNKITEWTSNNYMENGFGERWLGNVVCGAGFEDRINSENNRIRCRGSISWFELNHDIDSDEFDEGLLYMDVETAWSAMPIMWKLIIEKMGYKTIGFSFISEECGMEIYDIFDPYGDFPEKYNVDIYLEGEDAKNPALQRIGDTRYYTTDEYLIADLQTLLGTDNDNLQELISAAEHYPFEDEDSYISIHEYRIIEPTLELEDYYD